jgi:hypothetical protein
MFPLLFGERCPKGGENSPAAAFLYYRSTS